MTKKKHVQLSKLDSSLIFQQPVRTCHVIYPLWTSAPHAVELEKDRSPNSRNSLLVGSWLTSKQEPDLVENMQSIVKATIRVHTTTK